MESDPDLRHRLGRNARETAERHSLDRVGQELQGTYQQLLARKADAD
jgi:hypothetical protein